MTWVRIDDAAPLHPKLLRAGAEAAWLWVAGLAYANRHVTDGAIPREALPALYPHDDLGRAKLQRLAERLVDVGMWSPREGGGWLIHGYAEYQREAMRDSVEDRRRWEAERKAKQRAAARGKSDPSDSSGLDRMSHRDRGGTGVGQIVGHVPGHDVGHPVGHVPESSAPVSQVVSQAPVPSRPDPIQEEILSLAPSAPATVTPKPSREKKPAADPPPFSMAEAFDALATESRGRFVAGTERDWTKGYRIAVAKLIRAYPDLALWRRLGRWLAAGGDAFRGEVGPSWAARSIPDAMARAAAWEAQGGAPIAARGVAPLALSAAPARPAAPPPPPRPSSPRVTPEEVRAMRAALVSVAPKEVAQ